MVSTLLDGLFLSQTMYAHDILAHAHLLDSKYVATPMVMSQHLSSGSAYFLDPTLYCSLVGALQYLTITRLKLAQSFDFVNKFFHALTEEHFQAIKRIMSYAKGTLHFGLTFSASLSTGLIDYSKVNSAGCHDT